MFIVNASTFCIVSYETENLVLMNITTNSTSMDKFISETATQQPMEDNNDLLECLSFAVSMFDISMLSTSMFKEDDLILL